MGRFVNHNVGIFLILSGFISLICSDGWALSDKTYATCFVSAYKNHPIPKINDFWRNIQMIGFSKPVGLGDSFYMIGEGGVYPFKAPTMKDGTKLEEVGCPNAPKQRCIKQAVSLSIGLSSKKTNAIIFRSTDGSVQNIELGTSAPSRAWIRSPTPLGGDMRAKAGTKISDEFALSLNSILEESFRDLDSTFRESDYKLNGYHDQLLRNLRGMQADLGSCVSELEKEARRQPLSRNEQQVLIKAKAMHGQTSRWVSRLTKGFLNASHPQEATQENNGHAAESGPQ